MPGAEYGPGEQNWWRVDNLYHPGPSISLPLSGYTIGRLFNTVGNGVRHNPKTKSIYFMHTSWSEFPDVLHSLHPHGDCYLGMAKTTHSKQRLSHSWSVDMSDISLRDYGYRN